MVQNPLQQERHVGVGVGALLLKEGSVLLGRRLANPKKKDSELHGKDSWTLPGGKLEFGELVEDCVCREVLEETGIAIDKRGLKLVSVSDDITRDTHFTTLGFLVSDFEGEAEVREPDTISEWRWFSFDDLPVPLFMPSERVLKNYLDKTIYNHH